MPFEHCEHVYRNMNQNPCPLCGGDTHETDFKLTNDLHTQHLAEGKDAPYKCDDCGGTIRGWWDI